MSEAWQWTRIPGRWRGLLLAALLSAGVVYLAIAAWVYWNQERLIFYPEALPLEHRFDLQDVQELGIEVPGARLSALHLKLPNPKGIVFFLHGNNGNLATWFTNTQIYRTANYDLFMVDYRGYGKSSGRIESEAQLRADVLAAWRIVAPHYVGKKRVIYGRSLGTALAAWLAAEIQPDLTVLVSPYWSMARLMHLHYPLLPTGVLRYPLDTRFDAPRIHGALLLIHGENDRLIPIEHSEHLLAATPRARLLRVSGAAHDDIHGFPEYREELLRTLRSL